MPVAAVFFVCRCSAACAAFCCRRGTAAVAGRRRQTDTGADLSTIRIHSDRKWPERVVFDTNAPTIVPAPTQTASTTPAAAPAQLPTLDQSDRADAFAQLTPSI